MQNWPLCFILGRIVTHASHADSALVDYAGSARAPLTDHSRNDAGASRCSHSTAVMPATCSGSMHQRGCLSLTQHTSGFQDPQMCTRYVPLFPGGDAAGQSQVRSESDRAGSAEPARAWRVRRLAPIAISAISRAVRAVQVDRTAATTSRFLVK